MYKKIFQYAIILIYIVLIAVLLIDIYNIATNAQEYPLNCNTWSYCSVRNYIITNVFFILFLISGICLYFMKRNKFLFYLSFLISILYILFFAERNW